MSLGQTQITTYNRGHMKQALNNIDFNQISPRMGDDEVEGDGSTAIAEKVKVQKPRMYKVLMHNDDYTTMEFVIHVLRKYFHKSSQESQAIMLKIHTEGVGICGLYTFEVAESKAKKVTKYAKAQGHPLKCSSESE